MHWNSNERLKEIEKIPNMIKRQQKEEIKKKKLEPSYMKFQNYVSYMSVCACIYMLTSIAEHYKSIVSGKLQHHPLWMFHICI